MKRDMDLVRDILLRVAETKPDEPALMFQQLLPESNGEGDVRNCAYHVRMLIEQAEFLTAIDCTSSAGDDWIDLELTWEGQDFVEAIRDPETWRKTKDMARKAGGWTVEMLAEIAKAVAKDQLGKLTGLTL